VVRVVRDGRFSIYVLPEGGERHHLPHGHVVWSNGRTVLEIPGFRVLTGHPLPAAAWDVVRESKADIIAAWNLLNPERPIG
jgi:hypothetical protein